MNIHAGYLEDHSDRIPRDRTVVVHCVSGDRSSLATSRLLALGHRNVRNLTCGFNGWRQHGFPVESGIPQKETVLAA